MMPDSLTSIARRTLGVAPVAQPIIAPLFAPKAGLSAPTPALLEAEEMLETSPAAHMAHRSRSVQVNKGQDNRQESLHPMQNAEVVPPTRRIEQQDKTIAIAPASSNTANLSTPRGVDDLQTADLLRSSVSSPDRVRRDSALHLSDPPSQSPSPANLENDATKPAIPTSLDVQAAENSIVNVSDFRTHPQVVRAETDTPASPAKAVETHQHSLPVSAVEQDRRVPVQSGNRHVRNTGDERPASGPDNPSASLNLHATAEGKAVQDVAQLQQVTSWPIASPLPKREAASLEEQDLLLPNITGIQVAQSIDHTQTSNPTPVYQQDTLPTGRRTQTEAYPESQRPKTTAPRQTESAEIPPATPTIRVTIGRIDVRAVTAPVPTTRPQSSRSGPTLSLEDYTRQRKGGR